MSDNNKNLIVLLNPPYTNIDGIKESAGHAMPLNLAYLASYLISKGVNYQIKIIDAEAECLGIKGVIDLISKLKPKIVGITIPTPTFSCVIKITKLIKKEIKEPIILIGGGPQPTVMPEITLEDSNLDFCVIGEGEITFYELVKSIINNQTNYQNIKGIAYRDKEKILITEKRPLIANLDDIPLPARDLFDIKKYYTAPTKKISDSPFDTPILTSRGCAYNCTYCISKSMWGQGVRFRSVENVIKEMEECINKYGIKEFNFFDDTFTIDNQRVEKICQKILDKGWKIYWGCMGRVNTIDENTVKLMKDAGCRKISFGLESGNKEILKLMNKRTDLETANKAINIVRKHKIEVLGAFMIGNVGETKETIMDTINFARKLDLDNATFFIVCPYPGTEIYKMAREKGIIRGKDRWEEYAPLTKTMPILIQNNLTANELIHYQKYAFRKFYLRPKYIFRKFKKIKKISDLKLIFEGLRVLTRILKKKTT